jgi:ABC-2 type transport system ATP-binding protein
LIPPTSGTAVVAGCDVRTDPAGVRRRIGYVGQGHGAGDYFRVRDELVTQGRCYRMTRRAAGARADELLALLDLTPLARRDAATLSGGQARRLDLAIGLMHRPDLLFLDEPSTGLDPQNRLHLATLVRRLHREFGTTVLFSTHYLDEADTLADRVVIVDHGRVIADDSPANLKAGLAGEVDDPTLDDVFLTLTGRTIRDGATGEGAPGRSAEVTR